jgi:DNA invertase Pin-like site-specific DNA recombinase
MWVLCRGIPLSLSAEVDHIDGNKENNRLENLRLVPAEENTVRNLTYAEAEEIRRKSREGVSWKVLAEEFKISYSTIQRILAGKTHKAPTKKLVCGRL